MSRKHFDVWPSGLAHDLTAPATNLYYNAEVSAARYPQKPFVIFFGRELTFAEFKDETTRLAGFLQQNCRVAKGDRVLLVMQSSPQFIIAYYAVLRANAVVVPVNPMSVGPELEHYVKDSGARTAIIAQEVYPQLKPMLGHGLDQAIVTAYRDYVDTSTDLRLPEVVSAPRQKIDDVGVIPWADAL